MKPMLALDRILIEGLRSIARLDLPEQGLGWEGRFPAVAVLGGTNGSGKTTLFRLVAQAAQILVSPPAMPAEIAAKRCRLDFRIGDGTHDPWEIRFLVGDKAFVDSNESESCFGYVVTGDRSRLIRQGKVVELCKSSGSPQIVVLPSDNRDLVVKRKPGKRFARAFADLAGGSKHLAWIKGDLVVELGDGTIHAVDALSAGERQALVLLAELRRLWRPGSLVVIDELELHLHDAWQGKLYEAIIAMRSELGGQVILTTQSHALFEMAAPGTRALLGREASNV